MSNTKLGQVISGYKLPNQLSDGQKLSDVTLDSPDGKLYYQCEAKDDVYDPANLCDLWQTANKKITIRIKRANGKVDTIVETE